MGWKYFCMAYTDKSYNSLWGHPKYGGYIGTLCNGASVLEPDSFTSTDIPIYMSWVSFVLSLCAFIAGVTMTLADSSHVLDMFTLGLSLCSWVELSHNNLLLLWFWSCAATYVTTIIIAVQSILEQNVITLQICFELWRHCIVDYLKVINHQKYAHWAHRCSSLCSSLP